MSYISATPGPFSAGGGVSNFYKGGDVASATEIVPTGNVFAVTGTTTIVGISTVGAVAGAELTLIFTGVCTVQNGANLILSRGVNYVSSAGDVLKLVYDGTAWRETGRLSNLHRQAGDFNAFAAKAAPVSGDVLLLEDSADGFAKKKVSLSQLVAGGLAPQAAVALGNTSTSSATDTPIPGVSITPAAGQFMVTFGCSAFMSNSNATGYMSIYAGGVQIPGSERAFQAGKIQVVCMVALTTVNGAQAIVPNWRVTAGSLTAADRTLFLEKVG